jgi:hypothetical protein
MANGSVVFSIAAIAGLSAAGCASAPESIAVASNDRGVIVSAGCKTTGSHIRRRECNEALETLTQADVANRLHDAEPQKPDPSRPLD